MNFPSSVIDPEALLCALAQQTEPLPEKLQRSLQEVGQSLQQDQPDAAHQLRELIREYLPLESAYKTVLEQWDKQYASQHRAKSLNTAFQVTAGSDWLFIHEVMPTSDWVTTAKRIARRQSSQVEPSRFWDKTDRIAVMMAGGAALGGVIGQIPGAIVGGVLAATYGWYISFAKAKSVRNS
jgi:hypothetical protein